MRASSLRIAAVLLTILLLGLTLAIFGAAGQTKVPQPESGDKEGVFLIARRALSDPFFAKSTVLMLPVKSAPLVVGLIINKPTHVSLHDLFPDVRALQKEDAKAYFGGPVNIHDRSAIFRSATAPKDAMHIFADVYATFDPDAVAALVKNSTQVSTLRIFLGRAQWGQAQLQNEVLEGAWYRLRVDSDPIFSDHPGDVWQMLLDRVEPRPYVDYRPPAAARSSRQSATP
jgi:putative transcriptional regulator